jgi:hypothetical protein
LASPQLITSDRVCGGLVELFFTDRRRAVAAGVIPGIAPADVMALFARRLALDGTPVLLDEGMRPVEPLSSWFRHLALMGRSPKTMRKYAYVAVRLAGFLAQGGTDVVSATETDLLEFRALRTREAERADLQGDLGGRSDRDQRSVRLADRSGSCCGPAVAQRRPS